MWAVSVIDEEGVTHKLHGRTVRVVNAVIAHGEAINQALRGNIEVNWSDGETKVNSRTFYPAELESRAKIAEGDVWDTS